MIFLKLIRFNNWVKNSFILIPLFFSGQFLNIEKLILTLFSVIGFSLVTSFVYIINDIFDIEFDKIHPKKRHRPIPSGKVSITLSLIISLIFISVGLSILWVLSKSSFLLTIFYVVLNLLYSFKLKQISIIDLVIVSIGFIIRILIGSDIGNIELTQWIVVMVFLLSLFITVTKRRDDVYQYEFKNKINRKVVSKYTVEYLDKLIIIISSVLLVSYLLFITSENANNRYPSNFLIISFLFVLMGVFRYNQITYVENKSGSPLKILFKDIFLQISILLWIISFIITLYTDLL